LLQLCCSTLQCVAAVFPKRYNTRSLQAQPSLSLSRACSLLFFFFLLIESVGAPARPGTSFSQKQISRGHRKRTPPAQPRLSLFFCFVVEGVATHCDTLRHIATLCNILQHIVTHCNTLQHTATHCNTPQVAKQSILSKMLVHIKTAATHCNTLQPQLQHNATHCATLRHTATNYSTLQHTATHRRWPRRVFFRR